MWQYHTTTHLLLTIQDHAKGGNMKEKRLNRHIQRVCIYCDRTFWRVLLQYQREDIATVHFIVINLRSKSLYCDRTLLLPYGSLTIPSLTELAFWASPISSYFVGGQQYGHKNDNKWLWHFSQKNSMVYSIAVNLMRLNFWLLLKIASSKICCRSLESWKT